MKIAVIFSEGIKQIVFTPENKEEEYALSLLTPNDDIELLIKTGSMGESYYQPFTANISASQAGYLRIYGDDSSRILVLTPKKKQPE